MESNEYDDARTVYLPLSKLDECSLCGKTEASSLRLCSSCGERIYCSVECQKVDWPSHKNVCGKTDRIDLGTFYPFLATLAERSHPHKDKPIHPALIHKVLNDANPGTHPYVLPDGSAAKLLILGDELPLEMQDPDRKIWWPLAKDLKVMSKLYRRIMREGFVLPIAMSICIAILSEIYTTTIKSRSTDKRIRLRYRSSPISDFGIAAGSADVKNQDKLAYWMPDGEIIKGQDPDDHYWIYFTTVRGEEVVLDCAMFTFNMCMMVPSNPYMSEEEAYMMPFAPAFFRDRMLQKKTPPLHKERHRISFLRNEDLHEAIRYSEDGYEPADTKLIWGIMNNLAGRECANIERDMLMKWIVQDSILLAQNLRRGDWRGYPENVTVAVESEPGELDDIDSKAAEWEMTMKKWKRDQKKMKS